MKIFDSYMFRSLGIATIFVSVILVFVIFLTQSLRFLELVIESGASSASFWILTFLALPRFFEIILPLSLMAAILFIYNRMTMDSELIAVRATGASPMALARPAIMLGLLVTIFLWGMTMWVAPKSLASMQEMRQTIRSQFSAYLFREGVFNRAGQGLTIYLRERSSNGDLSGLLIHDSRDGNEVPSTILAKRGALIGNEDGFQVVVYDGSRQDYDSKTGNFRKLNFDRYIIDLPDDGPMNTRWQQPDERTIVELLSPDFLNERDRDNLKEFNVEVHRRITGPLLALSFAVMSCALLLLGPVDRRGQGWRIGLAIILVVSIEGLFLASFNMARRHDWALFIMYGLVLVPLLLSTFLMSEYGERLRRAVLYRRKPTYQQEVP